MTDLTSIVAASRAIDILHPATGEPVGLRLTLLPDSDPKVKSASRKALNERMSGKGKVTAEKIEQNRIDMLVASIGDWQWTGDLTLDGEKPAFSDTKLRAVLEDENLAWISQQVEAELRDTAAFFRSAQD